MTICDCTNRCKTPPYVCPEDRIEKVERAAVKPEVESLAVAIERAKRLRDRVTESFGRARAAGIEVIEVKL